MLVLTWLRWSPNLSMLVFSWFSWSFICFPKPMDQSDQVRRPANQLEHRRSYITSYFADRHVRVCVCVCFCALTGPVHLPGCLMRTHTVGSSILPAGKCSVSHGQLSRINLTLIFFQQTFLLTLLSSDWHIDPLCMDTVYQTAWP